MTSDYQWRQLGRDDPFYEEPLQKAFYHPTKDKHLGAEAQKIALSPVRTKSEKPEVDDSSSQDFLKGAHAYNMREAPTHDVCSPKDTSSKFDEPWPASERPSTLSIVSADDGGSPRQTETVQAYIQALLNDTNLPRDQKPKSTSIGSKYEIREKGGASHRMSVDVDKKKSTVKDHRGTMTGSTLSKYIHRFRHDPPMSRQEREQVFKNPESEDFWWIKGSPPTPNGSSTPKDGSTGSRRDRPDSGQSAGSPHRYGPMMGTRLLQQLGVMVPDSPKTLQLQEKADRLLEKTSSTVSTVEPAVSTEGLGSPLEGTTGGSSFEEPMYRPAFTRYKEDMDEKSFGAPHPSSMPRKKPRPEDDILYQWRLRRRLEQAREGVQTGMPPGGRTGIQMTGEMDSKLAEFRQRLAGTQAAVGTELHVTPDAFFSTEPRVPDKKIDVSCQTHYDAETSAEPHVSSRGSPKRKRRDFVPSPVASPHMKHRDLGDTEGLKPHLHLMCDILPCPHQKDYAKLYGGRLMEEPVKDDKRDGYAKLYGGRLMEVPVKDNKREDLEEPERDGSDSQRSHLDSIRSRLEFDSSPGNSDNEIETTITKDSHHMRHRAQSKKTGIKLDSKMADEGTSKTKKCDRSVGIQDSDTAEQKREREDNMHRDKLKVRKTAQDGGFEDLPRSSGSCHETRRLSKRQESGVKTQERSQDGNVNETAKREKRALRSKGNRRSCVGAEDETGQVPMQSAIDEVVGERLFMMSPEKTQAQKLDPRSHVPTHPAQPAVSETLQMSDQEEFCDDQILQDLRHKRAQYLQRLKDLDRTIDRASK